jgi:SRSO17 transposase
LRGTAFALPWGVDKRDLNPLEPALQSYLAEFADVGVAPTRRLIAAYIRGQLGPLRRKSVLSMAQEAGIAPRTLQELLSLHRWDENLLMQRLQQHVLLRSRNGPERVATLIETSHPKKGNRTPGVEVQRCGPDGRLRNCVVLLHLGYSTGDFSCVLDNAIFLPRSWTDSPERKSNAHIPEPTEHRTKAQIALQMLDRARANGFQFDWVYCGLEFASDDEFIQEIHSQGYRFVAARPFHPQSIPSTTPAPWISNDFGGASLATMLRIARIGDATLAAFEDSRRDIGLDHFEVRTYRSLLRHLALSSASILFLADQVRAANSGRQTSTITSRAL